MITTPKTDKPRFPILLSNASTLERRTVVNKKAKTSIKITSDMYGHIRLINHNPIKNKIIL